MEENLDRDALAARALDLHARGYNCAQSVACVLAPFVGADEDACFRATEGFGAGMGGLTETCGAISGGVTAIGIARSNGASDPTSKAATYRIVRQLVGRFREQNGATLCGDLKGIATKRPLRSCDGCIEDALAITIDLLEELRAQKRA